MRKYKFLPQFVIISVVLVTLSCLYGLFFYSPAANWDKSPDALIISEERPFAELDYNYIPDFQVWGDGRIVWVEFTQAGQRKVQEGYLTEDQMRKLVNRFIAADFFKLYRILSQEDYALRQIRIDLLQGSYTRLIDPKDKAIYDLVNILMTGAAVTGKDFIPTNGKLVAVPVEKTDLPVHKRQAQHQWPDWKYGYNLEPAGNQMFFEQDIMGDQLRFAWEVVNSSSPLVESNHKVYWIAVIVPGLSPFR